MPKVSFVLITISVLLGVGYYLWTNSSELGLLPTCSEEVKKDLETKCAEPGLVVFACKDIGKGAQIESDMVVEKPVTYNHSKIPNAVAPNPKIVVGKRAKFDIAKGQIVSLYDLSPYPKEFMGPAIYAVRDVPAGTLVGKDDVEDVGAEFFNSMENGITKCTDAIGRKAKFGLSQEQRLSSHDLLP
jgi:flagella basal body P-ring formation protein FlgA